MKTPQSLLVKMCREMQFAEDFRNGILYANRLSYFRDLENDQRSDPHEGVIFWSEQGASFTLTVTLPDDVDTVTLTEDDLVGPIEVTPDSASFLNIFCMYICRDLKFSKYLPEGAVRMDFGIHKECVRNFGEYAIVVTDSAEFLTRVRKAAETNCIVGRYGAVKYQDPIDRPANLLHTLELPFYKNAKFEYQQEFRIVFDVNADNESAICLNIGDISDISSMVVLTS